MPRRAVPFVRALALAVPVAVLGCAPSAPADRVDLAITNVTVVDPVDGARAARTVTIRDGRIVAVAPGDTVVEADRVVDGSGRYLIPGLWDFHVHLTYDDAFTEAMPALFLSWGVTSIRDTGGVLEKVLPVVEAIESSQDPAPRVFFAGPLLDGTAAVYDGVARPALGVPNAGPEAARARVAHLDSVGADFVKVYEMVTPEIFTAITDEAAARGLPVDGHVPLSMLARDVGPRVQSLEHLRNIELDCAANAEALLEVRRARLASLGDGPAADLRSELHALQRLPAVNAVDDARCAETIAAMASTIQVPTLRLNALQLAPPWERPEWSEALDRLPAPAADPWRTPPAGMGGDPTFAEWSLDLTGRMHAAGVPIGAGTDTPIGFAIPGFSLHSELEMLVRAGLSPIDALRAATLRPAEFFGLEGELGRIAPGFHADLVLLDADPLADITATRRIGTVISRGAVIDDAATGN